MRCYIVLLALSCLFAFSVAQENGDVRLEGDDMTVGAGRLEVFYKGEWGTVCFDKSRNQKGMAVAVCRQLGFNDVQRYGTIRELGYPDTMAPVLLKEVVCPVSSNLADAPQHILRCDFSDEIGNACEDSMDVVGIECSDELSSSFPYDTMVRLINNDSPYFASSSGFVEIYLNNKWGSVCNLNQEDADTVCRQLSYTDAIMNEDTNGTVLEEVLDDFACTEPQPCLNECFDYPEPGAEVNCNMNYSYVTCTFDTGNKDLLFGSQNTCIGSNSDGVAVGVIVGAVLGGFFGALICLMVPLLVCLCVPGCMLYKARSTRKGKVYSTAGGQQTKYQAI